MHGDKKIGLALAILLIGVVGAMFFRNEDDPDDQLPRIRDAESLDRRIAERDLVPYLNESDRGAEYAKPTGSSRPNPYDLPSFLSNRSRPEPPRETSIAPEPIRSIAPPMSDDGNEPSVASQRVVDRATWSPIELPFDDAIMEPAGDQRGFATTPTAHSADDTHFEDYVVRPGDTLSGLAHRFLGAASRYEQLYQLNRERISNPDNIQVGSVIRVPRAVQDNIAGKSRSVNSNPSDPIVPAPTPDLPPHGKFPRHDRIASEDRIRAPL